MRMIRRPSHVGTTRFPHCVIGLTRSDSAASTGDPRESISSLIVSVAAALTVTLHPQGLGDINR